MISEVPSGSTILWKFVQNRQKKSKFLCAALHAKQPTVSFHDTIRSIKNSCGVLEDPK